VVVQVLTDFALFPAESGAYYSDLQFGIPREERRAFVGSLLNSERLYKQLRAVYDASVESLACFEPKWLMGRADNPVNGHADLREMKIYGAQSFGDLDAILRVRAPSLELDPGFFERVVFGPPERLRGPGDFEPRKSEDFEEKWGAFWASLWALYRELVTNG